MPESMFTPAYRKVVAALVEMRKNAGLSQRDLAERLGRERSFVSRIETTERRVDVVELVWICRACDVDPDQELVRLIHAISKQLPNRRLKR